MWLEFVSSFQNCISYKCVALIIGTCDISSVETWKSCLRTGKLPEHTPKPIPQIVADYRELLETITYLNPTATVLITSIIPRPYDFDYNRIYLKDLNNKLRELANTNPDNYKFLNTAKQFIYCGEIKENLFIKDKIHLSPTGNKVLTDMLNGRIGQIISKWIVQNIKKNTWYWSLGLLCHHMVSNYITF